MKIEIVSSNDLPVATDQKVTVQQDKSKPINLQATDIDQDDLIFKISRQPANGTLSTITGAKVTYTPNSGFSGGDSFAYLANDGTEDSNPAEITIQVEKKLPPPSYTLELPEAEQTVKVGGTATFPIRVSGQNGYQQTVKLAVDKSTLPAG